MITVGELAAWIMLHRKGEAFKDYSISKIVFQLDEAITNNCLMCTHNGKEITGVAVGEIDVVKKDMFVYDILTIENKAIVKMLSQFMKQYPGYTLSGVAKNGKERHFESAQLAKRL